MGFIATFIIADPYYKMEYRYEPEVIIAPVEEKVYTLSAEFSAYTLSADETNSEPHIGPRNLNLYVLRPLLNVGICASRDLPLDTLIEIEGVGECLILDRMNIRYKGTGNIDILMDTKLEANQFGRKVLKYNIINR